MRLPTEQAEILLEQLDAVLRNLVQHPESYFTEIDTNNRLFSVTPANEPVMHAEVELLHHFVEVKASEIPNNVALEFISGFNENGTCARSWTYRDLNEQGNRVANLIQVHHIPKGQPIGICFDKCAEASFAILGILKAGCPYVALDPQAPVARKQFIVQDSKASLVLSFGNDAAELRRALSVKVIDLAVALEAEDLSVQAPDVLIQSNDVCYCLYTSGTTGTPKGCEM